MELKQTATATATATGTLLTKKSLFISLPFSAKQQREITSSAYFGERTPRRQIFWISLWNYRWHYIFSFSRFLDRFALSFLRIGSVCAATAGHISVQR